MVGAWRRAKLAPGMNLCVFVPKTLGDEVDDDGGGGEDTGRFSDSAAVGESDYRALMPMTPTPTSSGLKISKSGSRSSKRTCAICLAIMKAGQGHAIFTAECSHTFHFHCIASNVKHGNQVCPVCRAKWKEIPCQISSSSTELNHGRARVNLVSWAQDDSYLNLFRRLPRETSSNRQHHHHTPQFHSSEPNAFDDDEALELQSDTARDSQQAGSMKTLDIKTYPEFPAIPKSTSEDNFTVLIHIKAPHATSITLPGKDIHSNSATILQNSRAPVDLVTVLDISGSMAGTKLALLKRAMGFVIQNLGPSDRLSVIAFSSMARRLFHLRRMSESGRQQALQAVNSLVSSGGTNIAEGLRKGAKVIEERKMKNPVYSIILLSDGQDTYTVSTNGVARGTLPDYRSLVPSSIKDASGRTHQIPVHAFGFGADHDPASMHSISETSGGTFSFIEAEGVIQDAFAQCIGGLLGVVVQELRVNVECVHPGVHLAPIKSGSYTSQVADDRHTGSVDVGSLYADEDMDFLVYINVPSVFLDEVVLLMVGCTYRDPVSTEMVRLGGEEVRIERPESVTPRIMSIEVDRERNRLRAAEAIAEARTAADQGLLSQAVSILEARRSTLLESLAGRSGDRLCLALDAELKEIQERLASRQRYEASGRAYVLSVLSSHSWQRATAHGDSTNSASLVHAYQTPSMVDMVQRSQIFSPSAWRVTPPIRPTKSFPAHPEPR